MRHPLLLASVALLIAGCTPTPAILVPQATPRYPLDSAPTSPLHRMQWLHRRNADDQGQVLPGVRAAALQQRAAMTMLENTGVSPSAFTECGPSNISGRSRSLWIDPANTNRLISGSCGGGLWLSTNRGASWAPIDDNLGNLNISCIAQAPSDPNVLYAGTGEGYIDYLVGPGEGIWKSTDRGATWTQLASTAAFGYTNRIAVHPTDPSIVLAACNDAVRRSTDGGATWTVSRGTRTQTVAFCPHDGTKASIITSTAIGNSFVRSTDSGATFTSPLTVLGDATGRLEIAYAASVPGAMVGVRELNAQGPANCYSSLDYGATWQLSSLTNLPGNQWWYDNALWVSPVSRFEWVVGGTSIFRSTDPFAVPRSVTTISNGGANLNTPHSDVHFLTHEPGYGTGGNDVFYAATDGGIYRAENLDQATATSGWERLDNQLRTTQFYSVAGHADGRVTGGTQDNGWLTVLPGQTAAVQTAGGDGGYVSIDPTDPNYLFGEYQWMQITRSTDGGLTNSYIGPFHSTLNVPANERSAFIAPVVMSPTDPNTLFAGGYRLYRTTNAKVAGTPTWDMIRDRHVGGGAYQPITAIAVSSINPALVYIGYADGAVFVSSTALDPTPVWQTLDHASLPNRSCLRLVADHTTLGRAYASFGGYAANNLWRFDVQTSNWTNVSGSGGTALPAAPVYGVAQHPHDPNLLYAGTEVGLFASDDGGTTWSTSNQGPSDAPVYDVQFVAGTSTLLLGTYGRGIWKANVLGSVVADLGPGCAGTAGTPVLTSTAPRLGQNATLTVTHLPANSPGWMAQGYSSTSWFGNPLPFHLNGFGANGCYLRVSLDYLRDASSNGAGTFSTALAVANNTALIGQELLFQYFAHDPAANGFGKVASNALRLVLGY